MPSSCIYVGDYDPPAIYREKLVRAAKVHRCSECADEIQKGDLHEHCVGLWDGSWASYRTCARCLNVRADYFPDGWCFGGLVEDWIEAHGFDYRDGIPEDFTPCRAPESTGGDDAR